MSTQTQVPPPFQQWQQFYPTNVPPSYGYSHEDIMTGITDTNRFLTAEMNNLGKDISQTTLGLRDAVERGNLVNGTAIERVAGENRMTTITSDAASRQAANDTARDIIKSVEQANASIERVAGENRITTLTADAASRQAAADSARDISVSVERNGANAIQTTQQTHSALLGAIERNAGENRMTTVTVGGQSDMKLTDVRQAVVSEVNRGTSTLLGTIQASHEALNSTMASGAWENRNAVSQGFSASMLEASKTGAMLGTQSANHYSSLLLEQQKMGQFIASKADNHFAVNQLEIQKVKESITSQSSAQFAVGQLEQQKMGSVLSAQLADAKFEALKSQAYLADKMGECCCEIKSRIDTVDRDRLRDDNQALKLVELSGVLGFGGYGRGRGRGGRSRSRSPGRR